MANINLLPQDLAVSKGATKTVALTNKIAVFLGVLLVLITGSGIAYILLLSTQISNADKQSQDLKANIAKLENVEQQLFLIKDRVDKAGSVYSQKDISVNAAKINTLLTKLPDDISLDKTSLDSTQTSFSIISKSSLSMVTFINLLEGSSDFSKITLKSFNYTPEQGYSINIEVI